MPWSTLVQLGWLASKARDPLDSSSAKIGRHVPLSLAFTWMMGEPNSIPHACFTNSKTTKSPPQAIFFKLDMLFSITARPTYMVILGS